MQVKVFEAEDMRSALVKVKEALGPEALILSTREINTKTFGFWGKPGIEVTAAVDSDSEGTGLKRGQTGGSSAQLKPRMGPAQNHNRRPSQKSNHFQKYLTHETQGLTEKAGSAPETDLMLEIRQMKESFKGLLQHISQSRGGWAGQWPGRSSDFQSQDFDIEPFGKQNLMELYECGLKSGTIQVFAEQMKESEQNLDGLQEGVDCFLEHCIAQAIRLDSPLAVDWSGQKRLAFIGPTGVGKTTTIAKIAANCLMEFGKSVVLVTIDNYRIAAVEQLKIYGQIMNVPVELARTPEELKAILARHEDKDLILVDTAGRSPSDELSQEELADFLDPALNIENHLVLSATTRERDLQMEIDTFGRLQLKGLVFTKLDECRDLGAVLNLPVATGYPLSFLSNGQKVPEDLLLPEARQLAAMTLKKKEVTEQWNIMGNRTRQEHFVH
jgi:flagellar biosynthesis protein FlhF